MTRQENAAFDEAAGDATSSHPAELFTEEDASAAASQADEVGVDELPSGAALLVVTRGPNAGSRFLLDRPVTSAGRHPSSDIFLDDITVSRRHAEFRRDDREYRLVDVGSLNGSYVNRQPVDSALLAHGDEVQIGKFRMRFIT